MKIKSDAWDSGNYLTRFCEHKIICDCCDGKGMIGDKECSCCEGAGVWYEYY